jgi:hypothetical protein
MNNTFSKGKVYRRLLKNAGELWGIHESELESIDPLAKLMLGTVAKEVERIGNEVYTSDARIFRRLAQFLLPDELQSSHPAHAVLRMNPAERTEVSKYDEFIYEKKWKDKKNLNRLNAADIAFSSSGEFPVSDINLEFRLDVEGLKKVSGARTEELISREGLVDSNELLLVFNVNNTAPSPIRLYFDWMTVENKQHLFEQISKIRILDMANLNIPSEYGLQDEQSIFTIDDGFQQSAKLDRSVNSYYNERFIRFDWTGEELAEMPNELIELLEEAGESRVADLKCLRLVFPPYYSKEDVADVVILDNCVPVLNRKLEKVIFRLLKDLNIRKLDFENYFLEVELAESNKGNVYFKCPSLDLTEMSAGSYNIRIGGAGRLDERDGQEYLHYLMDLIRDEKQAFSALEVTSTTSDLNTIEQTLQRVKKRVAGVSRGSKQPYIIVKPHSSSENAHVHYWTTDGELANGIPVNSRLTSKNPALARGGFVEVVSRSVGGRNERAGKEMLQSFKSALLSRGTIVTKRDISELCFSLGGSKLDTVSVKNGYMTSPKKRSGLSRTIDVDIRFKPEVDDEGEIEHLRRQIQSELNERSNFAKPLRVIVDRKQDGEVENVE